jgi:tetratricopeptide (TPR) repeat protein
MFHLNTLTPEGFTTGLNHLREALKNDPADPRAYAGLALGYSLIASHSPGPAPDAIARAKAAATRAVELDETLAEPHAALAQMHLYADWDWDAAAREFQRALALNPNLAEAHAHYAWYLNLFGRQDEALAEMMRAAALDPLAPLWATWIGDLHWSVGRYDAAIDALQNALELDPNFPWAFYMLGSVYAETGLYEEAVAAQEKAVAANPDWRWALARTYAMARRVGEAKALLRELEQDTAPNSWGLAAVYTALEDRDRAFQWLESAYTSRNAFMPWLRVPYFAGLRDDPRFAAMLRRMNLPT